MLCMGHMTAVTQPYVLEAPTPNFFLSFSMADAEYPRPSYQHHAGLYRNIKPDDLKPWEWSPVTNHSLPQSPMRPVFHISKPYPPSLSGPLPSSTVMVVKIPGKSDKKKSLWHAICRLLRLSEFFLSLALNPSFLSTIDI